MEHKIIDRISARRRRALLAGLFVANDLALVALAFVIAHYANILIPFFHVNPRFAESSIIQHLPILPALLLGCVLAFSIIGLYDSHRTWDAGETAFSVLVAVSVSMGFVMVFSYMTGQFGFSRLMFIYVWAITFALVFLSRVVFYAILKRRRSRGVGVRRVLIAGLTETAVKLDKQYREHPELGCQVAGFLDDKDDVANNSSTTEVRSRFEQDRILGDISDLYRIAKRNGVAVVILTGSLSTKAEIVPILDKCYAEGIEVKAVPDIFEIVPRYMEFQRAGHIPVVASHDDPPIGWQVVVKRLMDILGALLGLLLLSPLFIVVAILIKLGSRGPIFFSQERSGQNGKPFRMYKFRSMVASAAKGPPVKVAENDSRVTRVGAFTRKTSIDELPQLFNVLKGDMSLVGPRPETFLYVNQYSAWNRRRLYLRPGLTGLAQARGVRGNTTIDEKTKYDLEYLEKQSVWLDIKIIGKTVMTLFKHKEAY